MGFLFDSLVHMLSSEPEAKEQALSRILGRVLNTAPRRLASSTRRIWHYVKVTPRPYAVSLVLGAEGARMALSLADAEGDRHPAVGLLEATADAARHTLVTLPEGCLGRSSHRFAILASAERFILHVPDYERILGSALDLVIPVTSREAAWIRTHGVEAFVSVMHDQEVRPWMDRVPGTTDLDDPSAAPERP